MLLYKHKQTFWKLLYILQQENASTAKGWDTRRPIVHRAESNEDLEKKEEFQNAKMQPGNALIKNYFFYTLGGEFKIN